jgi:hypothetical protein
MGTRQGHPARSPRPRSRFLRPLLGLRRLGRQALFSDAFEDSKREPDGPPTDSTDSDDLNLVPTRARDVVETDLLRAGVTAGLDLNSSVSCAGCTL